MLLLIIVGLALLVLCRRLRPLSHRPRRRTTDPELGTPAGSAGRCRAKPAWVVAEVIRLKALMPRASVRAIATTFNALWQARRGETVGKTWVAKVISAHQLEIVCKRAEIKKRRPWPMAKNRVWALDLTYPAARR